MIDLKKILNEDQDPKAIEKVIDKLNGFLMTGEEVQYIAVQKKPAVNLSPECVALTNKRVIFCRSKNLGLSLEFQDYVWKDVVNCHLKEGILGSEFTLVTTIGQTNKIDYLPKTQARKLYTLAQEQEEVQRELRRQMALEEKRAAAGNVSVNAAPQETHQPLLQPEEPTVTAPPTQPQDELTVTLQRLKNLFENGLITQEEYDAKKADVLSRI